MSTKRITANDILSSLPGRTKNLRVPRRKKSKQKYENNFGVVSRWRTLAMDLSNVLTGTKGRVVSFNASSGRYLVEWASGSQGYYDEDALLPDVP
jgi:hypothetical protein